MNLFSTEQVSKYHPDKVADQISDAILTECLRQDQHSHVACECLVKDTTVVLAGEITTAAEIDYEAVVRRVMNKLGYDVTNIINLLGEQSQEINNAVISDENLGAGDQGIMFGFACDETDSYLPFGFDLANKIIKTIEDDVEHNPNTILKGDAKTQVTVDLDTNKVVKVLISVCHCENVSIEDVRKYIANLIDIVDSNLLIINPSGTWTIGGPTADSGLTGRKIVCDQYGGYCPVGGGAFSGKDPSKVDRSASYMARKIAIDLVKKFGFHKVMIQLAYAIGVSDPMGVYVSVNGERSSEMEKYVHDTYDLTPKVIINNLDLYNLDYEKLAEGCHYRG